MDIARLKSTLAALFLVTIILNTASPAHAGFISNSLRNAADITRDIENLSHTTRCGALWLNKMFNEDVFNNSVPRYAEEYKTLCLDFQNNVSVWSVWNFAKSVFLRIF